MLFSKAMLSLLRALLASVRAAFRTRRDLALENLALRQQLALFNQRAPHPPISSIDRAFWSWLSRLFWRWKARATLGRPREESNLQLSFARASCQQGFIDVSERARQPLFSTSCSTRGIFVTSSASSLRITTRTERVRVRILLPFAFCPEIGRAHV